MHINKCIYGIIVVQCSTSRLQHDVLTKSAVMDTQVSVKEKKRQKDKKKKKKLLRQNHISYLNASTFLDFGYD